MSKSITQKKAPANAFSFAAEACQFAAPSSRANGLQRMPVNVLARTGNPVYHWYWEWMVHDFAGLIHKPSIAFDYRHDPDEPIGVANQFEIKSGNLYLAGELISRNPDDQAARIMDLGPAGVPYELSIHFDPRSLQLEYLPEGAVGRVNEKEVKGPLTIARQWELLRCAFCLTGIDGGTTATFEESREAFSVEWIRPQDSASQSWESLFQADSGQGKGRSTSPPPAAPFPAIAPRFHGNGATKSKWEQLFKPGKR